MSQKDTTGLDLGDLEQTDDNEDSPITKAIKKATAAASPMDDLGGGEPGGFAGSQGAPAPAPATPDMGSGPLVDTPTKSYNTRLMEGDPGKLADLSHAAKSPKYDFLQLAQQNKYNYDQLPEMLQALQAGPNGRLWKGWSANKDKLTFGGDPSELAPEWDGAKSVDAIGAYGDFANGGDAKGWRWGVGDDGGGAPAHGAMPAGHSMPPMPASLMNGNPALDSGDFFQQLLKRAQGIAGPASTDQAALSSLLGA